MNDCVFCKIINGDLPCYKIYEDEYTLAFLDIANNSNGHTLVIPKTHCRNILDCPEFILDKVMETVKKISKHYVDNCHFDGINIINANEPDAEQSVFHLHFHILPRMKNDKFTIFPNLPINNNSLDEIAKILKLN